MKPRPPSWVTAHTGQYQPEPLIPQELTSSETRRSIHSSQPRLSRSTVTAAVTTDATTISHHGGRPVETTGGAGPSGRTATAGSPDLRRTAPLVTASRYRP